uniref:Uncharacterized protein n=1 Tax=Rhipicephalus microplus TaxID=6941 RepID=A0A6G5AGP5_RHIMP
MEAFLLVLFRFLSCDHSPLRKLFKGSSAKHQLQHVFPSNSVIAGGVESPLRMHLITTNRRLSTEKNCVEFVAVAIALATPPRKIFQAHSLLRPWPVTSFISCSLHLLPTRRAHACSHRSR